MMKECPYTASSRDVSENTPPSALEISLVRGFCTPRPSRLPSGFALGQSLGPRGAKSPPLGNLLGLGECIFQYIPPLGSVRIHSFIIIREVLILTLSIFIPLQRCICLYPLATGMILNEMINSDHNIQSHPCPQRCTDQYCP